jgi:hypothetical protein
VSTLKSILQQRAGKLSFFYSGQAGVPGAAFYNRELENLPFFYSAQAGVPGA